MGVKRNKGRGTNRPIEMRFLRFRLQGPSWDYQRIDNINKQYDHLFDPYSNIQCHII